MSRLDAVVPFALLPDVVGNGCIETAGADLCGAGSRGNSPDGSAAGCPTTAPPSRHMGWTHRAGSPEAFLLGETARYTQETISAPVQAPTPPVIDEARSLNGTFRALRASRR